MNPKEIKQRLKAILNDHEQDTGNDLWTAIACLEKEINT